MMHLTLSTRSPWDSNYCDEYGQVLFKATQPNWIKFGIDVTISRRVIPQSVATPRDFFEPIGGFHCNAFKKTRIQYRSQVWPVKKFFKKTGSFFSETHQAFTGPDGTEYVWKVYPEVCCLFLDNPSGAPVATFHCERGGFFRRRRPASVDIFPAGEHMVELILVTLLYVEKLRQDKETSGGGDGGDDGGGGDGGDGGGGDGGGGGGGG